MPCTIKSCIQTNSLVKFYKTSAPLTPGALVLYSKERLLYDQIYCNSCDHRGFESHTLRVLMEEQYSVPSHVAPDSKSENRLIFAF